MNRVKTSPRWALGERAGLIPLGVAYHGSLAWRYSIMADNECVRAYVCVRMRMCACLFVCISRGYLGVCMRV